MSKLKLNDKNPSIKRILRELKDLNENPSSQFCVEALEDNLFDLHFTILGPQGTEFETGRYHGRIVLPNEYPFKPPNIMLLTPNGRFQLFTKICLSITGYHPEFWQPAWGIRTVLVALISFLNEKAEGAIGGIDTSKEERKRLAKLSLNWKCDTCGAKLDELDLKYTDSKTEADSKEEELVKLFSFAPEKGKNESKTESNGSGDKKSESDTMKNSDNTINTEDIKASSENNNDEDSSNEVNNTSNREINENDTTTTSILSVETPPAPSNQNSNTLPESRSSTSTSTPSPSTTNINQNTSSQTQQTQPSTKLIDTLIILAVAILLYYIKNSFI